MAADPPKKPLDHEPQREDDGQAPFQVDGPTLDVDGRLVNRLENVERFSPSPPVAPSDAPLELAQREPTHRDPTPLAYRDEPAPKRRKGPLVFAGVAALAVAALAALLFSPTLRSTLPTGPLGRLLPRAPRALVVTSEPSGAAIRIGSQLVGKTPWAGDNLWGEVPITLELAGYRPWSGTLPPGENATLFARLAK